MSKKNDGFIFNENASINWRAMVKPEYLYPNKEWFEIRNKPVPESIEGLNDSQLLIKLGGLKELAKIRGYSSVTYDVVKCEKDYVAVKCKISWKVLLAEEESAKIIEDSCIFEDMANATLQNTNDFCAKFLETIATNRAFVRCVRNYLGINIVADEEIDKSKNKKNLEQSIDQNISNISPQSLLQKSAENKINCSSFEDFKDFLRKLWIEEKYKNEDVKKWSNFDSIPAKECRKLLSLLN